MGVTTEFLRQLLRVLGRQQVMSEPGPISTQEAVKRTFIRIENDYSSALEGHLGITSGLEEIDDTIHGWRPGELVVVAGEAVGGTRSLLVQLLLHNGLDEHLPCAHFSPRRATERMVLDLLCELSGLEQLWIRIGSLSEQQWPKLIKAAGRLSEAKILWDDTPWASTAKLVERCHRLVERENVAVIFVDDLQQLWGYQGQPAVADGRAYEVLRALKEVAVELDIPIIAFGAPKARQPAGEDEPGGQITLADVIGADAIAEWADEIYLVSHNLSERFDGKELDGVLLEFTKTRVPDRRSALLEYRGRSGSFRS